MYVNTSELICLRLLILILKIKPFLYYFLLAMCIITKLFAPLALDVLC